MIPKQNKGKPTLEEDTRLSYLITKHGEVIPQDTRSLISTRYRTVTRAINSEFYNSSSDTQHSLYVGSYGRGTAIDDSDIDILIELPEYEYTRYDHYKGNGQSRLLQTVKMAIQQSYPRSNIRADGQVVIIDFSDGMKFEILPAFPQYSGTYKYPDTNVGGKWRSTNPRAEQEAMYQKNKNSNGLLFDTCKHFRRVRNDYYNSYQLSGYLIDSFIYHAMGNWQWTLPGGQSAPSGSYEQIIIQYLVNAKQGLSYSSFTLYTPGSTEPINHLFRNSLDGLTKVVNHIAT